MGNVSADTLGEVSTERGGNSMSKTPRTLLNDLERNLYRKVSEASFPPATASKRFMQGDPDRIMLSDKGRKFMAFIAHRFRRQYVLDNKELFWIDEWKDKTLSEEVTQMPHHFTKATVEASFWCNPCARDTMHRVDDGRRGPCLVCLEKLECQMDLPGMEVKEPVQEVLFGRKDIG
jgi:hypothetical protein